MVAVWEATWVCAATPWAAWTWHATRSMTLCSVAGVGCGFDEPHVGSSALRFERSCWMTAADDASVVVVPKHSTMHPSWICVTPVVICEEELGDGSVSSAVAPCAPVPTTCTVTLCCSATWTWTRPWQYDVQLEIWICVIVSDVVLDWTGAGGGVASAGGLPGFGASGGVWPDGVCVKGGGGAGAV